MELPYESAGEPMPEEERAALDAVEEIAERQSNKLTFKLKPGDILLTHNHVCMHKRSAFIDEVDPSRSRLMLRLWYNVPGGRAEAIVPLKTCRIFCGSALCDQAHSLPKLSILR